MGLAWKGLLPLALINLFLTAIENVVWPDISLWVFVIVNIVIAAGLITAWSRIFKTGMGRVEV